MAKISSKWLALLGGVALGAASLAHAQDSGPLIDALVKKGILNDQEAEEIRADLIKDFGTSSAGKLNLSSALTELKLSGDARVRYEYRTGENGTTGDMQERNRYRYRLRLALTGKLQDGWFFGTRIEPLANNRSTNITAGNGVTTTTGPFNKEDSLALGQVYIGREMGDFTVTAGRMPNPLVSTSMVWDDDINPEGLAEQWKHEDGAFTWMANLGQFVYEGSGTTNPVGTGVSRQNTYLWAFQGGAKAKVAEGVTVQVMPTYYTYSGGSTAQGVLTTPNSASLRPAGLSVIDIPVEVGFSLGGLPAKVFGDFAYNLDADARAVTAGQSAFQHEDTAYMIGFGVGQSKAKGDWEAKAFWQSVDAFAVDTNLVDSDLFDSRTNMEGFVLQGVYVISNGVNVKLTYANADRKNDSLATYGAGDIGTANLTHYQLFQADLNVKF